jgi:heme-degrading monooxygenase HmoA
LSSTPHARSVPAEVAIHPEEHAVQHVRVAGYKMTKGTPEETAALAEQGMLPLFRSHQGFIGYSLLNVNDAEVMSVSVWQSHQDAEEATALAAEWVAENLADRVSLEWSSVGDAMFNAGAFMR